MLPPGHIAGGYLAATALLKLTHSHFTLEQIHSLLALGAFFGFAPDLDYFYAFAKIGRFTNPNHKVNHRHFFTHAPLVWLAVGLSIYFIAADPFIKYIGLVVWLGSWSHFVLDSIEFGVQWLWPFTPRLFGLKDVGQAEKIPDKEFMGFWTKFVKYYFTRVSFYLEIIVIIIGILTFTHG